MTRAASGPGKREVAAVLRKEIRGGKTVKPGNQLPSIPQLQDRFKASVGVVRDALAELEHERLIEKRGGIGTFVTEPDQWTTTEAAEVMQQIAEVRAVVDQLQSRVAAIERRQRQPAAQGRTRRRSDPPASP